MWVNHRGSSLALPCPLRYLLGAPSYFQTDMPPLGCHPARILCAPKKESPRNIDFWIHEHLPASRPTDRKKASLAGTRYLRSSLLVDEGQENEYGEWAMSGYPMLKCGKGSEHTGNNPTSRHSRCVCVYRAVTKKSFKEENISIRMAVSALQ